MAGVRDRPGWPLLLWGTVGVLLGFGVLAILSVGIYVLAAALVLAVAGLVLPASRSAAVAAIVPGLGAFPLVVGISNLGGPGESCSASASSVTCTELLVPWPFLLPGLLLVVGGTWLVARVRAARVGGPHPGDA